MGASRLRVNVMDLHLLCCLLGASFYMCVSHVFTCSLTLREERRLRVFENRVLRKIFGPKRDEVTGEWRKLHNKELNDLYSSPKTDCIT